MKKHLFFFLAVIFLLGNIKAQIINEFHYDNTGTDVGEFVEIYIPNPQPVNLADYTIYLVNGGVTPAITYGSIGLESITPTCDAAGCYYVWDVVVQNGTTDGIAIYNDLTNTIVQFISYEGMITNANIGTLTGLASTYIGIAQAGTEPVGSSLQLISGAWVNTTAHTKGLVNGVVATCSITGVVATAPVCSGNDATFSVSYTIASPSSGVFEVINTATSAVIGSGTSSPIAATVLGPTTSSTINIIVGSQATPTCVSSPIAVAIPTCPPPACALVLGTPTITCNASTAGTMDAVTVTIPFTGGPEAGVIVSGSGTIGGDNPALMAAGNITVTAAEGGAWNISVSGGDCTTPLTASGTIPTTQCPAPAVCAPAIINEFHYDNTGTDTGEFVEIYIPDPQPADLSIYSIYLMNGPVSYGSINLADPAIVVTSDAGGSYYVWNVVIQNGAADGIALTCSTTVLEFLSYEGVITGAAFGTFTAQNSTDIGIAQTGTEPVGSSLQLISGAWVNTTAHTKGLVNGVVATCSITGVTFGTPGACNDNGTPTDATDDYYTIDITVSYTNAPATGTLDLTGTGLHSSNTLATTSFASPFGASHTFTGVLLLANNSTNTVIATFSALSSCTLTNAMGPAVAPCSTPPPCNANFGVFPHQ